MRSSASTGLRISPAVTTTKIAAHVNAPLDDNDDEKEQRRQRRLRRRSVECNVRVSFFTVDQRKQRRDCSSSESAHLLNTSALQVLSVSDRYTALSIFWFALASVLPSATGSFQFFHFLADVVCYRLVSRGEIRSFRFLLGFKLLVFFDQQTIGLLPNVKLRKTGKEWIALIRQSNPADARRPKVALLTFATYFTILAEIETVRQPLSTEWHADRMQRSVLSANSSFLTDSSRANFPYASLTLVTCRVFHPGGASAQMNQAP